MKLLAVLMLLLAVTSQVAGSQVAGTVTCFTRDNGFYQGYNPLPVRVEDNWQDCQDYCQGTDDGPCNYWFYTEETGECAGSESAQTSFFPTGTLEFILCRSPPCTDCDATCFTRVNGFYNGYNPLPARVEDTWQDCQDYCQNTDDGPCNYWFYTEENSECAGSESPQSTFFPTVTLELILCLSPPCVDCDGFVTRVPTAVPTPILTHIPTTVPTQVPTPTTTLVPTPTPTYIPTTPVPTPTQTHIPTTPVPTPTQTHIPTAVPTSVPTSMPAPIAGIVRCNTTVLVSTFNRANHVNQPSGDIVLEWDFHEGGVWEVSTCSENTNFNTWLSIYGDREFTNELFSEDDYMCGVNVSHAVLPGDAPDPTLPPGEYYIVVDGFANNVGQAELSITCQNSTDRLVCGNCAFVPATSPDNVCEPAECDNTYLNECVCAFDRFCCETWDTCCARLVAHPERLNNICKVACEEEPAACETEPVVPNAAAFTSCSPTPSGEECAEPVQCRAGFDQWGEFAYCFQGQWSNLPGCANPNTGAFGHLWFTTFDSLVFSYHKTGVIRLWESLQNNMDLQIRTLRPTGVLCDATIIGQIAFRAGDQLITAVGSQDTFEVRYNGVIQNNTLGGTEVVLGTGRDELRTYLSSNTLWISSKHGALLSITFNLMPNMSWLTVNHVLDPRTFHGTTRGLLGPFDGLSFNDFTLRDDTMLEVLLYPGGDHYGEQMELGDSWVLSDSESLFGTDEDAIADIDSRYTANPVGSSSVACPLEFPDAEVPMCDSLEPAFVLPCYFDVVLGGEQFLDDLVYQGACGSNSNQYCSFHGKCVNDVCVCNEGWSGDDCEERVCPSECVNSPNSVPSEPCDSKTGHCNCVIGFTGPTCQEEVDCSALDDCNPGLADFGLNVCVDNNVCECQFSSVHVNEDCSFKDDFTRPPALPTPPSLESGHNTVSQCAESVANNFDCLVDELYDTKAAGICCRDDVDINGPFVQCAAKHATAGCFPTTLSYAEARDFCAFLFTDGVVGWRLCTPNEIVEECCEGDNADCHPGLDVWTSQVCEGAPPSQA